MSLDETDPRVSGPLLHADLVAIFPALRDVRICHSWCGTVAYTFDELMHVGQHDGMHYAMGYCGSGVGMGSYLGMRVGQQVLGQAEGRTAFDGLRFPRGPSTPAIRGSSRPRSATSGGETACPGDHADVKRRVGEALPGCRNRCTIVALHEAP